MIGDSFMKALRSTREVYQATAIQPAVASVPRPQFKQWMRTAFSADGAAIHATRDVLSVAPWGSTKPNDFISISGYIPPQAPVIIHVPTIASSNIPQGGGMQ